MSARLIFDTAPLGSLIRFSNGEPRPPERFTRKLNAWNGENGVGRLIERTPERVAPTYRSPASFCLYLGDYGSQDIIVLVIRRHYFLEGTLHFAIGEMPRRGMVRVLGSSNGRDKLHHLASDMAAAERWLANNRFSNMRVEIVSDPDSVMPPCTMGRAA